MNIRNEVSKLGARVGVAVAGVYAGAASAAIQTTDLTPVGTEITGDISTVVTWVLPIMGVALAAGIGIKLVKRFANKI